MIKSTHVHVNLLNHCLKLKHRYQLKTQQHLSTRFGELLALAAVE